MLDKKFIAISGIYGNAILLWHPRISHCLKYSHLRNRFQSWQKCASQSSSKYTVHNPSVDSRDLPGPYFDCWNHLSPRGLKDQREHHIVLLEVDWEVTLEDIQSPSQTLAGWKAPCSPSKVKGSGQPRPGEDFILSKSSRPRDKDKEEI